SRYRSFAGNAGAPEHAIRAAGQPNRGLSRPPRGAFLARHLLGPAGLCPGLERGLGKVAGQVAVFRWGKAGPEFVEQQAPAHIQLFAAAAAANLQPLLDIDPPQLLVVEHDPSRSSSTSSRRWPTCRARLPVCAA